jgi:hypothetical protein
MPPKVTIPPNDGYTTGPTYTLTWVNAHGIYPPKTVTNWRVTIGTDEGLNDKYDSGLVPPTVLSHTCTMPADNNYYYVQVEWTGNSPGISKGNYFQSLP